MPAQRSTPSGSSTPKKTVHVRTYQACESCRAAKLRCDLGSPDAPRDPPCRRCLRTGRQCKFTKSYQRKTTSMSNISGANAPPASAETSQSANIPFQYHPLTGIPSQSFASDEHGDFKFVRAEALENPADALRILCAAAEEDAVDGEEPRPTIQYNVGTGLWNQWVPVRDGLMTADEATALLAQ
ncbi:hypothetical protein L486_08531 [Kwoniella mangroviensis CBS 10435]|uniref:Zn(2)-C6 fungal-type domain-containing protein n=1 Tax=Kwoniella mangroviensis CBS 10435 TaxID=1331196 RepID=A0A1B9IEW3_9TREE|nr:hypothetical protein L486_08531 [Kwoniella mangroviensis CBS 10435]